MIKINDKKNIIQENQYEYPYHYIPSLKNGNFSHVQYWSWGLHYLGGLHIVLKQLENLSFNSLLDIGCGDGRFLRAAAEFYPNVKLLGVDRSERAICLAKAMNPEINYETFDIFQDP